MYPNQQQAASPADGSLSIWPARQFFRSNLLKAATTGPMSVLPGLYQAAGLGALGF